MAHSPQEDKAGGISVHAVDVSRGVPAAGLAVRLRRIAPNPLDIAAGSCSRNGHFEHAVATGSGVERGLYEVEFDVGRFYREIGLDLPDPSFIEVALFRFGIDRVKEHFHLPFKFTPWGFSLFRGGA